jgi:hypothetical protein
VYETGSRASFAGLVLGGFVAVFGRRLTGRVFQWTFVAMVIGFFIGFYPDAANLFRSASESMVGVGASFARSSDALYTVSGRAQIWADTRSAAAQSWIVGWGPDTYRFQHRSPNVAAHSWALEYVASVGVLGTLLIATLLVWCYFSRGQGLRVLKLQIEGKVWNAATALALLPNLVLSTHQWTLWAWTGFAMWSTAACLTGRERQPLAGSGAGAAERPGQQVARPGIRVGTNPRQ